MLSERFELRPGALVVGPDESLGWIDALLAIPGGGQISGFVLSEGPLFDRGIRVPIEAVERTEDSRVHVWLTAAQLNDLADIQARRFAESTAPPEDRIEALGGSPTVMARRGRSPWSLSIRPPTMRPTWSSVEAMCSAAKPSCR